MGRMKIAKRISAFFLFFEKKGKRMSRVAEATVRGKWGAQSLNIPCKILEKGPMSWSVMGSMIGWPL
jgi:hypothetical protein